AALDAFPASPVFSDSCGLFFSLCTLFDARLVCFQYLADSFCKTPGGRVPLRHFPPSVPARSSGGPLRYHLPFFFRPFIFIHLPIPSRRASICNILCFHALTNPFFCNFFVFTSIQNARVSPPPHNFSHRRSGPSSPEIFLFLNRVLSCSPA